MEKCFLQHNFHIVTQLNFIFIFLLIWFLNIDKVGFLKQQNSGSTSLSILVPNDGINLETGERPVLLGSLIGKLSHGVGSIPGFREDRRNLVKTGRYLILVLNILYTLS